ncbi:rod-binding protein [Maritalea sp.]|uniref:rod-binding protein n=1 Tax=Maritalea sp. TaxID=2003361 RepID=UPI003EFA08FF
MPYSKVHIPLERPAHMPERTFERLKQKAVELEGVFLNTLMSQISTSVETDGPFGGGHAEETWRGMMATEHANNMAQAGGIGLSDSILRDLIATQATTTNYQSIPAAGAYK